MRRITTKIKSEDVERARAGRGGDEEILIHATRCGIQTGGRAKPPSKT